MALDYTAYHRDWQMSRALVAGSAVVLTDLPSRRLGFDTPRSTARMLIETVPTYVGGEAGTVDVGWNGTSTRFFTGLVQTPKASMPTMAREVALVDLLGLLQKSFTADITWSDTTFVSAVVDILTAVGINEDDLAYCHDPGLTLGPDYEIVISVQESPEAVWRELMDYGGTRAVVFPNGKIYVLDVSGIPSESFVTFPDGTPAVYAYGASGDELPIIDSGWQLDTVENPVNAVYITGPTRASDGATPSAEATLSATGRPYSRQFRFVQNADDAETIADRELSRMAVARKTLRFKADSNLDLYPGMSIGFRDSTLGIVVITPAFVWSVNITGPVMDVTCLLGAHVIDGYSTLLDPVAVPVVKRVEKEPILIAGVPTTRYFVQFDGRGSFDLDGEIVSYSWTFTGGGATPASSTEAAPLVVFTTLDGTQTATLTVTDDHTNTHAVTVPIPASTSDEVVTRELWLARLADGFSYLGDGATWQHFTRPGQECTAVPPISERASSILSGWDDGKIYKLSDSHGSIELVTTLAGGAIGAMWRNEGDGSVLVAAGARLYRDPGDDIAYTLLFEFDDPITDIESSPASPNEIRVLTDRYEKISFDGGASWADAVTGASGTMAEKLASAPWGHAVVFSGGADETEAIDFEEGHTVDWSGVVSPPASLYGITPLLSEQGYLAIGAGGDTYSLIWDGSTFVAELVATLGEVGSDILRDGDLDSLAYATSDDATDGKAVKLVNQSTYYDILDGPAAMAGYGRMSGPGIISFYDLYQLSPEGSALAVHHWTDDAWHVRNTGIDTSWLVAFTIIGCPFDENKMLFLASPTDDYNATVVSGVVKGAGTSRSPLLYSSDRGLSWTDVSLPTGLPNLTSLNLNPWTLAWSDTEVGKWLLMLNDDTNSHLWRGTNGTAATSVQIDDRLLLYVTSGIGGDYVVAGIGDHEYWHQVKPDNSLGGTSVFAGHEPGGWNPFLENAPPPSRVVVGAFAGDVYQVPDYRGGEIKRRFGTGGNWATIATHGLYIGGRVGVGRTTDVPWAGGAPFTVVYEAAANIGAIRADRQSRTIVAAHNEDTSEIGVTEDGENWTTIAGPGVAVRPGALEVVKRS